jgi:hypothetical protein
MKNEWGETIQAWLKRIGRDRDWLAAQVGAASRNTVDKWLGPNAIVPPGKLALIQKLMNDPPEMSQIRMPLEVFQRLQRVHDNTGIHLEDLIIRFVQEGLDEWDGGSPVIKRPSISYTDIPRDDQIALVREDEPS